MLKSKATSLARAGESVTYIFMGGSGKTEAVMSIANKIDFANNPNITVLSQQDLEEKYREEHPWWPSVPSPLSLIKFYIEKEKPKHLMVDEVPLEKAAGWQHMFRFQIWILDSLVLNFGVGGILMYFMCNLFSFLCGGTLWWIVTFCILLVWCFVGCLVYPFSLDKTGSLLTSLIRI